MKRPAPEHVTLGRTVAFVASAAFIVASGCLNPRPEELPSNGTSSDPDVEVDMGGQPGAVPGPIGSGDGVGTPSPTEPSLPEEGVRGPGLDGGSSNADAAADAGAPVAAECEDGAADTQAE